MKLNLSIIETHVRSALSEDIGSGDITSQALSAEHQSCAEILTREDTVICGIDWVTMVFKQLDPTLVINWRVKDGDHVQQETCLARLQGKTRALLSGERVALNFLQTLSGVSTTANRFNQQIKHTGAQLLDTRKTIPGLRYAQKYAVWCGGGHNHRMGLYDACLIKENHIMAMGGSIESVVAQVRQCNPDKCIVVEVESIEQLKVAIHTSANRILLDNFTLDALKRAVDLVQNKVPLEVSGNITLDNIKDIAEVGVNYISVGRLTKNLQAIDLSMRIL